MHNATRPGIHVDGEASVVDICRVGLDMPIFTLEKVQECQEADNLGLVLEWCREGDTL